MAVGAEVITGLLSSIVYDGLKRPFKGMTDAAARRRGIHRALLERSGDSESARAGKAIDDLAKVLANDEGAYTDKVALFLSTVERSAIPDTLKQFALCGREAESIFPSFDMIYASCAPLPFKSKNLFDALNAAVRLRIEQRINDPALYEAMRAQNGEIYKRLDAINNCLANARNIGKPLPIDEYNDCRSRVARIIEGANKQLNVETTNGTKKVHIKKLVINSRVSQVGDNFPTPHRDTDDAARDSIAFVAFRRSFDKAVILGDPGGGKSTLTQLLCYSLANQIVMESGTALKSSFDSRDLRLPLRIILRSLDRRQQKNPSYSIFDYLVDEYRPVLDNDPVLTGRFLRQALTLGNAVVLFDGLDEILEIDARRSMTTYVEQFADTYASCPILVTSRIVGYKDAPLSDDYDLFTLSRFNEEEVRKYSEQLMRAVGSITAAEASKSADRFLSQSEHNASDLRENPLLLGLMVYIYMQRGDVPNNRPEIYKECSLLMFEKWDQRRDIIFSFPQDFDLLDLFGFLAREIFGNAETEDGVDEEWLKAHIRTFFDIWYEDKAKSVSAAKVLVKFITGRAWVMCEIGPGRYKFTHRTFLEYFFARRLEEESSSLNVLINSGLYEKIIKSEWDVVSHLALQIATFRSGPKSQQASDILLDLLNKVQLPPQEEINLLLFIARSLEYLSLPEARIRELTKIMFEKIVLIGSTYSIDSRELVHELLRSTSRRGEVVKSELDRLITPIVNGPDSRERTFCLYLMGTRYAGYKFARSNTNPTANGLIWSTFAPARKRSQADQMKRARLSASEARTYAFVYNNNYISLYNRHGFGLFIAPPSALDPYDIAFLPYAVISEGVRAYEPSATRLFGIDLEKTTAISFVSQITKDILTGNVRGIEVPFTRERYGMLEECVVNLAHILSLKKSGKANLSGLAECLICYLFLLDLTSDSPLHLAHKRAELIRGRKASDLLPRTVARLEGTPHYPLLLKWLAGEVDFAASVRGAPPASLA